MLLTFLWGAVLLPRLTVQLNFSLFLALAAAGFFSGAWMAAKIRKIQECTLLFFMAIPVLGVLIPFPGDAMLPFFVFGFWLRTRKEDLSLPFLAPLFLFGGIFTVFFHGNDSRFFLTLFFVLLAEMLISPNARIKGKFFRFAAAAFLFLLPGQKYFPVSERQPFFSAEPKESMIPLRTLLAAVASLPEPRPNVLILPCSAQEREIYHHLFPQISFSRNSPFEFRFEEQYDLIVLKAETTVGTPGVAAFLAHRLAPDGRLLLPEKESALLPGFCWRTMPDEGEKCRYLLGGKRAFALTPEIVEKNLLLISRETGFMEDLLPGEISGMFVDFSSREVHLPPPFPSFRLPLAAWLFPVFWLVAEIFAFRRARRTELLLTAESAFAFAAVTALLLENFPYENYPHCMEFLLPGIALIWLFCRPALRCRMELLLTVAGILGVLIWSICGGVFWSVFSLIAGGFAFSGEMRRKQEPVSFSSHAALGCGLCLGFLAAWGVPAFTAVTVQQALWGALTLKIWTTLRN